MKLTRYWLILSALCLLPCLPSLAENVRDLSCYDANGKPAKRETANCYVVHEAGRYSFPCVYGNGIQRGVVTSAGWKAGLSGRDVLSVFVNAYDKPVVSSWIADDIAGAGETLADAVICWQDADGLLTEVKLTGAGEQAMVEFTVPAMKEGNALVAVRDRAGKIVWSWHIWCHEAEFRDITLTDHEGRKHFVMDTELGTASGNSFGDVGACTYYQWGRKDPMPPCDGRHNMNAMLYSVSEPFRVVHTAGVTLGESISSPNVFYSNTSNYAWCSSEYANLWDIDNTAWDKDSPVAKTIYDPCPAGYHVPGLSTFTGFTQGGGNSPELAGGNIADANGDGAVTWEDHKRGWKYKADSSDKSGAWFRATGYRNPGAGKLSGVNLFGYRWLAEPAGSMFVRGFIFNMRQTDPRHGFGRCAALAVRPEKG